MKSRVCECVLAQWAEEIGYPAEPTTAQRPTTTSSEPGDLCSSRARRSSANGAAQWNHRQTKVFSAPPPVSAKCFTFWPTFTSQQTMSNGEPNSEWGQIFNPSTRRSSISTIGISTSLVNQPWCWTCQKYWILVTTQRYQAIKDADSWGSRKYSSITPPNYECQRSTV